MGVDTIAALAEVDPASVAPLLAASAAPITAIDPYSQPPASQISVYID